MQVSMSHNSIKMKIKKTKVYLLMKFHEIAEKETKFTSAICRLYVIICLLANTVLQ